MPLVRITVAQGTPEDTRRAIADGVHRALVDCAGVPRDDRFQVVEQLPAHDPAAWASSSSAPRR